MNDLGSKIKKINNYLIMELFRKKIFNNINRSLQAALKQQDKIMNKAHAQSHALNGLA